MGSYGVQLLSIKALISPLPTVVLSHHLSRNLSENLHGLSASLRFVMAFSIQVIVLVISLLYQQSSARVQPFPFCPTQCYSDFSQGTEECRPGILNDVCEASLCTSGQGSIGLGVCVNGNGNIDCQPRTAHRFR